MLGQQHLPSAPSVPGPTLTAGETGDKPTRTPVCAESRGQAHRWKQHLQLRTDAGRTAARSVSGDRLGSAGQVTWWGGVCRGRSVTEAGAGEERVCLGDGHTWRGPRGHRWSLWCYVLGSHSRATAMCCPHSPPTEDHHPPAGSVVSKSLQPPPSAHLTQATSPGSPSGPPLHLSPLPPPPSHRCRPRGRSCTHVQLGIYFQKPPRDSWHQARPPKAAR